MVNQTVESILNRRSVRFYQDKPVPRDVLDTIIRCGNHAPTGGASQMWRFVVVQDAEFRKKLAEVALPRYRKWMAYAPEMLKRLREDIDKVAKEPIYYDAPAVVFVIGKGMTADFDCPMVCENMMIAAHSMGLGSCWVYFGQFAVKDPDVKAALELEDAEKVYGPILLGYPQENLPPRQPKSEPKVKII